MNDGLKLLSKKRFSSSEVVRASLPYGWFHPSDPVPRPFSSPADPDRFVLLSDVRMAWPIFTMKERWPEGSYLDEFVNPDGVEIIRSIRGVRDLGRSGKNSFGETGCILSFMGDAGWFLRKPEDCVSYFLSNFSHMLYNQCPISVHFVPHLQSFYGILEPFILAELVGFDEPWPPRYQAIYDALRYGWIPIGFKKDKLVILAPDIEAFAARWKEHFKDVDPETFYDHGNPLGLKEP